jgi:hypothetical protein
MCIEIWVNPSHVIDQTRVDARRQWCFLMEPEKFCT